MFGFVVLCALCDSGLSVLALFSVFRLFSYFGVMQDFCLCLEFGCFV